MNNIKKKITTPKKPNYLLSTESYLEKKYIVLISFILLFLFSLRDLLVFSNYLWPHIYSVIGVSKMRWEESICFLPILKNTSIFLNSDTLYSIPLFPKLTLLVSKILYFCCFKNFDIFLYINHAIIPLSSFWLLYLIFRVFISKCWALLLALFGIYYFSDFSSFHYIIETIFSLSSFLENASLDPPEISKYPFPSISFFFFALIFYLTIRTTKANKKILVFLSLLWGIQIYIYIYNFVAGFFFFIGWVIYIQYFKDKQWHTRNMIASLCIVFLSMVIIISPYIISYFFFQSQSDIDFSNKLAWITRNSKIYLSGWGFTVAYLLPIITVIISIHLFRGDYYELFYKFSPVFVAMLVDFLLGSIHLFTGKMLSPELYYHRISGILFRFFFIIPPLYFISNPLKQSMKRQKKIINQISCYLHFYLQKVFIKPRLLYFISFFLLLGVIEVFNSIKYYNIFKVSATQQMQEINSQISLLKNENILNQTVIFEKIETNLAVPILSDNKSILVNTFNTRAPDREILDKIICYVKLFKWSEEEFIDFMLPKEHFHSNSKTQKIYTDKLLNKGLGYWLIHHQKVMDVNELENYKKTILNKFYNASLSTLLKQINVSAIVSENSIDNIEYKTIEKTGKYFLIKL